MQDFSDEGKPVKILHVFFVTCPLSPISKLKWCKKKIQFKSFLLPEKHCFPSNVRLVLSGTFSQTSAFPYCILEWDERKKVSTAGAWTLTLSTAVVWCADTALVHFSGGPEDTKCPRCLLSLSTPSAGWARGQLMLLLCYLFISHVCVSSLISHVSSCPWKLQFGQKGGKDQEEEGMSKEVRAVL